jgi:hypothetical protein
MPLAVAYSRACTCHHGQAPEELLPLVFEIAEKHVGVPRLLEASDLLGDDPDERAIQLYVSLFFDAFSLRKVNAAFAPPHEGLLRTSSPHLTSQP